MKQSLKIQREEEGGNGERRGQERAVRAENEERGKLERREESKGR